jgi:hypothetical protein
MSEPYPHAVRRTPYALQVFEKLDVDNSGDITKQEFIEGISANPELLDVVGIDCSDPTERAAVLDGFSQIDNDGGGSIELDELNNFIKIMRSFKTGFTVGQVRSVPRSVTFPTSLFLTHSSMKLRRNRAPHS